MKYKNKTLSLSRLIITPVGVVQGQCDSCKSLDCTHRVEFQEVSLFGVNKTMRCLINGGEPMLVIDCDGYTKR